MRRQRRKPPQPVREIVSKINPAAYRRHARELSEAPKGKERWWMRRIK